MDVNVIKDKAVDVLNKANEKVGVAAANLSDKAANVKADLKNLDMGIMLTKVEDLKAKVDVGAVKHAANELIDGPVAEKVKGAARTAKDFGGYVTITVGDFVKGLKK